MSVPYVQFIYKRINGIEGFIWWRGGEVDGSPLSVFVVVVVVFVVVVVVFVVVFVASKALIWWRGGW